MMGFVLSASEVLTIALLRSCVIWSGSVGIVVASAAPATATHAVLIATSGSSLGKAVATLLLSGDHGRLS